MEHLNNKGPNNPVLIRCPVCLKRESHETNDLICATCHSHKLEETRSLCLENEIINSENRNDINTVFYLSGSIRQGKIPEQGVYSKQSMVSIKRLSLQLLRRELINQTIKNSNIKRSIDSIQQKVINLNEKIITKEQVIMESRDHIKKKRLQLKNQFEKRNASLANEISFIQHNKILQIERQILQKQYNNYKVLIELSIGTRPTKYTQRLASAGPGVSCLLFNQPVIRIEDFYDYNNKLFQLNGFLENLIRIQLHIVKILNLKLPYLDDLSSLLPDSEFYDLVQKKENFMIHGGEMEVANEPPDVDKEAEDFLAIQQEKLVKLGNTIKLPLSSKTINNQLRRASLARTTSDDKAAQTTEPRPPPVRPLSKDTLSKLQLSGKKVIIVPHKILTKPFTRLTSKEYLRFLSVIVKTVINFKVIFELTVDLVPKKYSTGLISLAQLRGGSEVEDLPCDFNAILLKLSTLKSYFDYSLEAALKRKETQYMEPNSLAASAFDGTGSSISTSSELSSKSGTSQNSSFVSFIQQSDNIDEVKAISNTNRPEGLKSLYANLFKDSAAKLRSKGKPKIKQKSNDKPYGLISEIHQRRPEKEDIGITGENELKSTMQKVHTLMANGPDQSSKNKDSIFKNSKIKSEALHMMAQSKSKLDDWDVVSKMYSQ